MSDQDDLDDQNLSNSGLYQRVKSPTLRDAMIQMKQSPEASQQKIMGRLWIEEETAKAFFPLQVHSRRRREN